MIAVPVKILGHRTRVVCTNESTLQQGNEHIRQVLLQYSFPPWALIRLHINFNHRHNTNQLQKSNNTQDNNNNRLNNNNNIFIVGLYFRELGKRFKKACNSLGVQVHFKGSNTICTLIVAPKDKDTICQKVGGFTISNAL